MISAQRHAVSTIDKHFNEVPFRENCQTVNAENEGIQRRMKQ